MSDAQRPDTQAAETVPAVEDAHDAVADSAQPAPTIDVDGNPIPSPEVLADQALPAVYSRSPRLVRVVATGGAIGAVVGFTIGLILPSGFLSGRVNAGFLVGLAGALAGALIAGIIVANEDSRTARHVARHKAQAIDEWLGEHPSETATEPDAGRQST